MIWQVLRLLEVNLEVLLEVQVGDLGLVIHAEELGECGVGDDATLEGWVKAVVGLHILGHILGHLGLRALGAGRDTHKVAELIGERALHEEGVVGTTGLPSCTLLRGHLLRRDLTLLLGITGLLLGCLGCLLSCLHGLADLGGELGRQCLELLSERCEEGLGGLSGSSRNNGGSNDGWDDNLGLGGGLFLGCRGGGLGCLLGRCSRCGSRGSGLGGGLLISRHRV